MANQSKEPEEPADSSPLTSITRAASIHAMHQFLVTVTDRESYRAQRLNWVWLSIVVW